MLDIAKPVVWGQGFGGFVAQRYLARHPAQPARVVLSSTSHHMDLARKLAMFERLGGTAAREAKHAFWTDPGPATWGRYITHGRDPYNTMHQPTDARLGGLL